MNKRDYDELLKLEKSFIVDLDLNLPDYLKEAKDKVNKIRFELINEKERLESELRKVISKLIRLSEVEGNMNREIDDFLTKLSNEELKSK